MSDVPSAGEVAYFVHLHLNTVRDVGMHVHKEKVRMYHVEGKPRPMLVLMQLTEPEYGERIFIVLPITTKPKDGKDRLRTDLLRIGDCIDKDRNSFISLRPQRLPGNLLSNRGDKSPIKEIADSIGVRCVFNIVMDRLQRNPALWAARLGD